MDAKPCFYCGSVMMRGSKQKLYHWNIKKFCNNVCSAKYNNKLRKYADRMCKICRKSINHLGKNGRYPNYCSSFCRSKGRERLSDKIKVSPYEYLKRYRHKQKEKAVEYKGGSCYLCSYSFCLGALTFHHLDPLEKDFTISSSAKSFEKIKYELDKCVLLCIRCHLEVHNNMVCLIGVEPITSINQMDDLPLI